MRKGNLTPITLALYTIHKECAPVYWFSIAPTPKGILDRIRKKNFSFLWMGRKIREGIPLVKQTKLTSAKEDCGWGIKNIYIFIFSSYFQISFTILCV